MRGAPPKPHRWSRERYDACVVAGIFRLEDKVQLIDGELIEMSPQDSPHSTVITTASDALRLELAAGLFLRIQMPLALSADSEPEPDLAVVAGRPRQYSKQHPKSALLVVEAADTSLEFDRERKRPLYAQHGIPEYWIVNLNDQQVEVHRELVGGIYRRCAIVRAGEWIEGSAALTGKIRVDDLLP